jgi:hypothetical protein
MAALETEHLDHDERADDGDVAVYRARAGERLEEIARERVNPSGGLNERPYWGFGSSRENHERANRRSPQTTARTSFPIPA